MATRQINVVELIKGTAVMSLFGGLAAYLFVLVVTGGTRAEAFRATAVVVTAVLGLAALNGLGGILPAMVAASSIFGFTLGEALGGFLGGYRRARGIPDEQLIQDIKETTAAVINLAAEAPLFRQDEESLVSRYQLNSVLTNMVMRYHDSKPISRNKMVAEGLLTQRYWNLANRVLQAIGQIDPNTRAFVTRGGLLLDLEYLGRHWRVSLGREVWVLPEDSERWEQLDLYACKFLRRKEVVDSKPAQPN
jgi:hypothetical protein